jgi:hypothetical protein
MNLFSAFLIFYKIVITVINVWDYLKDVWKISLLIYIINSLNLLLKSLLNAEFVIL